MYAYEILFLQSSKIVYEVYNTNWYEIKPREANLLLIIMRLSQRPFQLTAGKFFVLSLETFAKVCSFVIL